MKSINMSEYNPSLGILVSLEDKEDFVSMNGSINMDADKITSNPSKYLDKNKTYYFYCRRGTRSRRVVQILGVYGYKVVKVTL